MADIVHHGRCGCGAVKTEATGDPLWVAHCHCLDCRRATASPFTTYAGFAAYQVRIDGPLKIHESSPGTERGFCELCGTPILFRSMRWPGETHLFVASFADAAEFKPTGHVYTAHQLPWIRLDDGLPRNPATTG